jgi:hypothetical protein
LFGKMIEMCGIKVFEIQGVRWRSYINFIDI